MPQSKRLTKFYNAYNDWLKAGAPERVQVVSFLPWVTKAAPFSRHYGLCLNLNLWYHAQCWCWVPSHAAVQQLVYEQAQLFRDEGLDSVIPFGHSDYVFRRAAGTFHQCPKRIDWVKAHLKR